MFYNIANRYDDDESPIVTGHWIEAESKEEALKIMAKYKIGYPFGRRTKIRRIIFRKNKAEFSTHYNFTPGKARVWSEVDGCLSGVLITDRLEQIRKEIGDK